MQGANRWYVDEAAAFGAPWLHPCERVYTSFFTCFTDEEAPFGALSLQAYTVSFSYGKTLTCYKFQVSIPYWEWEWNDGDPNAGDTNDGNANAGSQGDKTDYLRAKLLIESRGID